MLELFNIYTAVGTYVIVELRVNRIEHIYQICELMHLSLLQFSFVLVENDHVFEPICMQLNYFMSICYPPPIEITNNFILKILNK